jgi:hypothetical protein
MVVVVRVVCVPVMVEAMTGVVGAWTGVGKTRMVGRGGG